jgi:hypothetical protein
VTFAQWRNRLTMHFSECIPIINWRMTVYEQSAVEMHQILEHFRYCYLSSFDHTDCRYFLHMWNRGRSDPCLDVTLVSPSVSELCLVCNPLVLGFSSELTLQKTQDWNGHWLLHMFLASNFRWYLACTVSHCALTKVIFQPRRVRFLSVGVW